MANTRKRKASKKKERREAGKEMKESGMEREEDGTGGEERRGNACHDDASLPIQIIVGKSDHTVLVVATNFPSPKSPVQQKYT